MKLLHIHLVSPHILPYIAQQKKQQSEDRCKNACIFSFLYVAGAAANLYAVPPKSCEHDLYSNIGAYYQETKLIFCTV